MTDVVYSNLAQQSWGTQLIMMGDFVVVSMNSEYLRRDSSSQVCLRQLKNKTTYLSDFSTCAKPQ